MTIQLRKFYETANQVNDEPLVCVFEDFLSPVEIGELLAAAEPQLKKALVSDDKTGVESAGRTGRNCWVHHHHNDVISELSQRVSDVVGIPLENAESLQVVHYAESQQYAPHFDAWQAGTPSGDRCMSRGGQRMVTCLMYLNDVEQGGGTCFPKLDMEVRAKKGRMVLFHNCVVNSTIRHESSLHGGMPVLRGEKWACNFWFRERSYAKATTSSAASGGTLPQFKRVI